MSTPHRVLRWSFARANDRWQCELAFNMQHALYELRVWDGAHPRVRTEYFSHVTQAVLQQSAFEERLVQEGYSLQAFTAGDADATATDLPIDTPHVLVVNSSADTCDMLQEFFRLRGWAASALAVRRLRDGEVTPEALVTAYRPDLIVFDVALPYVENWAALQGLRGNPHVLCPFVVTSTNEAVLRRLTGTEEPILEIVGKPYDLQRLYDAVLAVLNGYSPSVSPYSSDRRKAERRTADRRFTSRRADATRTDDARPSDRRGAMTLTTHLPR